MNPDTPVIVLRPPPGCDATVAAARAIGLEARGFPLFAVAPQPWTAPPATAFDALLLGSANAVRHAGPALANYSGAVGYAVGRETARAAADAGVSVVMTGSGGLQQVLGQLKPGHLRLLRLTGETRTPLDPPPGVTIEERVVYASKPLPLAGECAAALHDDALVLLHSGEAARHFARECDRLSIDRSCITLAALAPRIAGAAGDRWAAVHISESPSDPALLALAAELCQIVSGLRGTNKTR